MENLKDLLRNYNSEVPIQFGHRFKYLGVGHPRFEFTFVTMSQYFRDTWQGDQGMSFQRWRHFKILLKHKEKVQLSFFRDILFDNSVREACLPGFE